MEHNHGVIIHSFEITVTTIGKLCLNLSHFSHNKIRGRRFKSCPTCKKTTCLPSGLCVNPVAPAVGRPLKVNEPQTDLQGFIDPIHHLIIEMGDFIGKPLFVNGSNLFQQNDGVTIKSIRFCVNLYVCRQFRLLNLSCNGSDDDRWTKAVANIVLDYEYGSYAPLFGAYDR
jgi:hypothetical protein